MMHKDCVPPDSIEGLSDKEIAPWKTEYDVTASLQNLGHAVVSLGLDTDLGDLRRAVDEFKPHIVFNLLEEFDGEAVFDQNVVSFLELMRVAYTGSGPRGLILSRDKALSKQILKYHRIRVPDFAVFPMGRKVRKPRQLRYPLFVKSLVEEASLGISQASIVESDEKLVERVAFIHDKLGTDAIAEQYIDGREFYVGILGNQRLQVLPVWELVFTRAPKDLPRIATARVKWDASYQDRHGITTHEARDLDADTTSAIVRLCKRAYRALDITGYARMDLRMSEDGQVYLIECNPNPQLAYDEDFANAAEHAGMSYEALIHRIISLGLQRHRRMRRQ
jgi:D-alanine-D-alanine ligase